MKKCIIIGAGDFSEKIIIKDRFDLLIVADGGYYNFLKLDNANINDIDILIGDFDSLNRNELKIKDATKIITLNTIKDDTDILDAAKYGLEMGYKEFYIYGALGGRIEHSIANIGVLSYLKDKNANGYLLDNKKIIRVIKNERILFDEYNKGYISAFSMYEKSSGVTMKNLKYELNDYTICENYPIGIDNEFIGKESYIEVKDGKLLLIYNLE